MTDQEQQLRHDALQAALRLPSAHDEGCVLAAAQRIFEWLSGGPSSKPGKSFQEVINSGG